jgi:hypothetical protein
LKKEATPRNPPHPKTHRIQHKLTTTTKPTPQTHRNPLQIKPPTETHINPLLKTHNQATDSTKPHQLPPTSNTKNKIKISTQENPHNQTENPRKNQFTHTQTHGSHNQPVK